MTSSRRDESNAADRGAGKSRKDPGTYATAYRATVKNFAKVIKKRDTKLRYVGKSHVACLLIMFLKGRLAMPSRWRENVRHATLLFCVEGVNVRTTGAGEKESNDRRYEVKRCDSKRVV